MKLTIGLEIHAQLNTKSKLFSGAPAIGVGEPNNNVKYFDIAIPGTLPKLNKKAIELAIKAGKALNCTIHKVSIFDRKHYTYPDLPFGFQITQFYEPIATEGFLEIKNKNVRINRIHLECDAGKMVHEPKYSMLDFNRAGVPLIEIVSYPDMNSAEEAANYVREIILALKYTNVCDCNMELGNLRIDVNLSLSHSDELGTRIELKNLNSVNYMIDAINYEEKRLTDLINKGESFKQQTRSYDAVTKTTKFLRLKEDSDDYRYFNDFNIPPVILSEEYINSIKINKLPNAIRKEYESLLDKETLNTLVSDPELFQYFEDSISSIGDDVIKKQIANLISTDLMGICNKNNTVPYKSKIISKFLTEIGHFLSLEKISIKTAKYLIGQCFISGNSPEKIIQEENLEQITDLNIIQEFIDRLEKEYSQECNDLKTKPKLLMFLVGKIASMSNGKINPTLIASLIEKKFL